MNDIEEQIGKIRDTACVQWFLAFYETDPQYAASVRAPDHLQTIKLLGLPENTSTAEVYRLLTNDFLLTCHLAAKKI